MDCRSASAAPAGFLHGASTRCAEPAEVYFDWSTALSSCCSSAAPPAPPAARAADAAELAAALSPRSARSRPGRTRPGAPVEGLAAGAPVEIRAGDRVPADGDRRHGPFDLDALAAQQASRDRWRSGPATRCFAGALNVAARLEVRVRMSTGRGHAGRPPLKLVEEAAGAGADRPASRTASPARLRRGRARARRADPLGRCGSRAIRGAPRPRVGAAHRHLPCTLALATPLAMTSAIGRAARARILIKRRRRARELARPRRMRARQQDRDADRGPARARALGRRRHGAAAVRRARPFSHPIARALPRPRPAQSCPAPGRGHPRPSAAGSRPVVQRTACHRRLARVRGVASRRGLPSGSRPRRPAIGVGSRPCGSPSTDASSPRGIRRPGPSRGASVALARVRRRGWRPGILSGDSPRRLRRRAGLGFEPRTGARRRGAGGKRRASSRRRDRGPCGDGRRRRERRRRARRPPGGRRRARRRRGRPRRGRRLRRCGPACASPSSSKGRGGPTRVRPVQP